MSGVKWDVKEIMSQHSSYVDVLLQVRIIYTLYAESLGLWWIF